MNPWNKNNLINFGVIALAALVAFFSIVAIFFTIKAGGAWSLPLPVLGVAYGIYTFVKKYYVVDVYKD